MKIALDLNCLTPSRISGIGVYASAFSKALDKVAREHHDQVIGWVPFRKSSKLENVISRTLVPLDLWNEFNRWWAPPDIVHGLDFKIPRFGNFKKVVTVHDLVEFEEDYNSKKFIRRAQKNFRRMLETDKPDHIVAISDFTASEIYKHFPDLKIPVSRVYHGMDHRPLPKLGRERLLPDPYFLFVGTLEKRKNPGPLIAAFEELKKDSRFAKVKLVLAGNIGFEGEKTIRQISLSSASQSILHLPRIDDAQLASLYQYAEALVLPTLYEGFGFPAMEAMRMNTAVITSNFGAVHEITGNAALKIDPRDPRSILEALRALLTNSELKEELRKNGSSHSALFTWERTARQSHDIYRQLQQIPK